MGILSDNNYENRATVKVVRQQLHELTDLRMKYKGLAEDFSDLRIMNSQLRGENKKYKVLLQVATKEVAKLRKEFLKDLERIHAGLFQAFGEGDYLHYIEEEQMKWEGKLK